MSNDQSFKSDHKPSKFTSSIQVDEAANKYIDNCKIFREMPNLPGLSLYLGFDCVGDMNKWVVKNKRFERSITRARTILEHIGIQRMTDPSNKNGNGSHRYMSKAFGYNDKLDIDSTVTTRIIRLPGKVPAGSPIKQPVRKKKPVRKKRE